MKGKNKLYKKKKINLKELQKQFSGKKFRELIRYHMRRQKPQEIAAGIYGTISMLSPLEQEVDETVIDYFNIQAYSKEFWGKDCGEVFNEITLMAKEMIEGRGGKATDEGLFNIFNIVVLNYAFTAYEQKNFRKFVGI